MGLMFGSIIGGTLVAFGPPNWLYSVAALPVIIGAGIGYWWAGVKFRNWGWQIGDRWIEAKHGVVGHHRVVIPRNRIQTVTTNSGPIDRMLDLETITVHTAGAGAPNLTIPHLATSTVEEIRSQLGQGVHA
jgi:membrane protein YdbS with pleckstrin-like domain